MLDFIGGYIVVNREGEALAGTLAATERGAMVLALGETCGVSLPLSSTDADVLRYFEDQGAKAGLYTSAVKVELLEGP